MEDNDKERARRARSGPAQPISHAHSFAIEHGSVGFSRCRCFRANPVVRETKPFQVPIQQTRHLIHGVRVPCRCRRVTPQEILGVGALVGAGASLIGLWIHQHFQTKRERLRIAAELGQKEYKQDIDVCRQDGGGYVAPVAGYVYYHARLLDEMSKGKITKETVMTLTEERDEILSAISSSEDEHR